MPVFTLKDSNGNVRRVKGPAGSTREQAAAKLKQRTSERMRVQDGGSLETLSDAAVGAGMGASMGFLDELIGKAAPYAAELGLIEDDQAQTAQQDMRDRYDLAKERSPYATFGGELAGGVALPGVGAAKTGLSGMKAIAGAGAGLGALSGAGYSEADSMLGVGADAVSGGVAGGVAGLASHYLLAGAGALGRGVKGTFFSSPEQRAVRLFDRAVKADDMTRTSAQQALSEHGDQMMPLDLGPNLLGLAGTAYRKGAKKPIGEALTARNAGQAGRVTEGVRAGLSPKWDDYWKFSDDIIAQREAQSKSLYDEAFKRSVSPSKALDDVFATDAGKAALRSAERNLSNDLRIPADQRVSVMPDGNVSVRLLDQVKKEFDDKIGSAIRGGENQKAARLTDLKKRITGYVDDTVEEYRLARGVYAGAKELEEASELGRTLLSKQKLFAGDLRKEMAGMTEGEADALRIGYMRSIMDKLETTRGAGDSVKRILGTQRAKDISRVVFGDEVKYDDFVELMGREGDMFENSSKIMSNSLTAERLAQDSSAEDALGLAAGIASFNPSSPAGVLQTLKALVGRGNMVGPDEAASLAPLLTGRNIEKAATAVVPPVSPLSPMWGIGAGSVAGSVPGGQ